MHFAIYCVDRPDSHEMRCDHRAAHRAYLDTQLHRIFFSGPLLADDACDPEVSGHRLALLLRNSRARPVRAAVA